MASRRRKEPDPLTLLRFIAEHESLAITADEFPEVSEERIREILRAYAAAAAAPPKRQAAPAKSEEPTSVAAPRTGKAAGRVVVFTDGASRGNPGPAGAGWAIYAEGGELVARGGAFLGRRTNNEAEYEAVIRALVAASELGATEISLRADSELMVKQMNGSYRVKEERLQALHSAAREVLQRFRRFDIKHVRREQNAVADAEANAAIDAGAARAS